MSWKDAGLLDHLAVYLFSAMLVHIYLEITMSSYSHMIVPARTISMYSALILFRLVLTPLIMLIVWRLSAFLKTVLSKACFVAACAVGLAIWEYAARQAGLFHYEAWRAWWSYGVWIALLSLTVAFGSFFRYLRRKDAVHAGKI